MAKIGILGVTNEHAKKAIYEHFANNETEVIIFNSEATHLDVAKKIINKDKKSDFSLILTKKVSDDLISKMKIMSKKIKIDIETDYDALDVEEPISEDNIAYWIKNGELPEEEDDEDDFFLSIFNSEDDEEESIFSDTNVNDKISEVTKPDISIIDDNSEPVEEIKEVLLNDKGLVDLPEVTSRGYGDLEEKFDDVESDLIPGTAAGHGNDVVSEVIGEDYDIEDFDAPGKDEPLKKSNESGLKEDDYPEDFDDSFFGGKSNIEDFGDLSDVEELLSTPEDENLIDDNSDIFDNVNENDFDFARSKSERELSERLERENLTSDYHKNIPVGEDKVIHLSEKNENEVDRELVRAKIEYEKDAEDDRYRPEKNKNSAPSYIDVLDESAKYSQQQHESSISLRSKLNNNLRSVSGNSRVFWVTGSSGGVGKTTVSWSSAVTTSLVLRNLASKRGDSQTLRKVFLIEADIENSKLQNLLDVDHSLQMVMEKVKEQRKDPSIKDREIGDAVENALTVDEQSGVHVLCAPYDISSTSKERQLLNISATIAVDTIRNRYPDSLIFVDAGNLVAPKEDRFAAAIMDQPLVSVIIVTGPTDNDSDNTIRAYDLLTFSKHGEQFRDRVTNKVYVKHGYGVDKSDIYICVNRLRENIPERRDRELSRIHTKLGTRSSIAGIIPELEDLSSGEKGWVNDAPAQARGTVYRRTGRLISRAGISEIGEYFNNEPTFNSDSKGNVLMNFINKIFSRNLD